MPARGSGMSRAAMAANAGIRDPREVSPETRQKISEALHRFHGTQPGDKRKRAYVAHPRPASDPRAVKSARSAARKSTTRAPSLAAKQHERNRALRTPTKSVAGAKLRAQAQGVQVTHRRRMSRTAHLISAHVHRKFVGLVHVHHVGRRNRSLIHIRGRTRAHRVWRSKLGRGRR